MLTPEYDDIQDIILEMWDYCMALEDEYHRTGDPTILTKFAVAIVTIQYWEDIYLNMEGFDVFRYYF